MTVPVTALIDTHLTDGVATNFEYSWRIINKAHLLVTLVDVGTEAEEILVLDDDYSVNGVGEATGSIDADTTYPPGYKIVITSNAPEEQPYGFRDQGSVHPDRIEDALDYLGTLIKKLSEKVSRAILTNFSDASVDPNTFLATILGYRNDSIDAKDAAEDAQAAAELAASQLPLTNYSATTNPTVNDDSNDGYSVGSKWYNLTADEAYVCLDATPGAASWQKSTLTVDELSAGAFMAKSSQAQARAGTDDTTIMTPLRVRDAYGVLLVNTQTASYAAVAGDTGKLIRMNSGSALNLTIDQNIIPDGGQILIEQSGTGQVTVVAGTGVTINQHAFYTKKLRGQYSQAVLTHNTGNVFTLAGHLEAA